MSKEPLYQDEKLKIEYLPNSHEDHLVYIRESSGEEYRYVIQRGILEELARTARGGIENKLQWSNQDLLFVLKKENISVDALHIAICQAYAEEKERVLYHKRSI